MSANIIWLGIWTFKGTRNCVLGTIRWGFPAFELNWCAIVRWTPLREVFPRLKAVFSWALDGHQYLVECNNLTLCSFLFSFFQTPLEQPIGVKLLYSVEDTRPMSSSSYQIWLDYSLALRLPCHCANIALAVWDGVLGLSLNRLFQ